VSTLELGLAIINCDYKTTEGSTQFTASNLASASACKTQHSLSLHKQQIRTGTAWIHRPPPPSPPVFLPQSLRGTHLQWRAPAEEAPQDIDLPYQPNIPRRSADKDAKLSICNLPAVTGYVPD
jgi:hypothetical protein